jgi:putative transposase
MRRFESCPGSQAGLEPSLRPEIGFRTLRGSTIIWTEPLAYIRVRLLRGGGYTHRVALSNDRLLGVDNGQVCFRCPRYPLPTHGSRLVSLRRAPEWPFPWPSGSDKIPIASGSAVQVNQFYPAGLALSSLRSAAYGPPDKSLFVRRHDGAKPWHHPRGGTAASTSRREHTWRTYHHAITRPNWYGGPHGRSGVSEVRDHVLGQ